MKFKVGDRVRVRDTGNIRYLKPGDTCRVIEVFKRSFYPIYVERESDCENESFYESQLELVKPAELTLETLQVGDEVEDEDGDYRKVLAVPSKGVYIFSRPYEKAGKDKYSKLFGAIYTSYDIKDYGYEPVQPENKDEITELTIDEIAEKFGVDAKKVKIKK